MSGSAFKHFCVLFWWICKWGILLYKDMSLRKAEKLVLLLQNRILNSSVKCYLHSGFGKHHISPILSCGGVQHPMKIFQHLLLSCWKIVFKWVFWNFKMPLNIFMYIFFFLEVVYYLHSKTFCKRNSINIFLFNTLQSIHMIFFY